MLKYKPIKVGNSVASSTTTFEKSLPELTSYASYNTSYKQIKSLQ